MNDLIYTKTYAIEDVHLDCFGRLKPSMLLSFVQDISGAHAAKLGAGWEDLNDKNLFWAIIRHRIQIRRMPRSGEVLRLETWPMPTTRTAYPRATVAYDEQGEVVFRTTALWVLMDRAARTMVLPGKSGVTVPGILRETEADTPGALPPVDLEHTACRQVVFSELDRNAHMNNTRYLDWIADLLSSEFHACHTPSQIQLCYLSELRENQTAQLCWTLGEDSCLRVEAKQKDGQNQRVFGAQIQF